MEEGGEHVDAWAEFIGQSRNGLCRGAIYLVGLLLFSRRSWTSKMGPLCYDLIRLGLGPVPELHPALV